MIDIDVFDEKILKIVRQNNRTPSEKIAEQVGLSTSAVQRRLRRLRKDGVIEADVSIISPKHLGNKITAVIGITLEKEHTVIVNDFKNQMLKADEVAQCYFVTGDADFILIVSFKGMEEYEQFTRKHFKDNPNIKRYYTNIVINQIKTGFKIR
jgi:DNA-binding Lrp family transcriptional regulator